MRFQVSTFFKILGVGVFLLIFTLVLQAGPTPDDGGDLFKQKCSMCHGVDGKGYSSLKTPDFTEPKVQASLTDKEIVETIKNGKKGTAMPAFADKLSDEQINTLLTYLRSLDSSKKK
ncbi:MAG: cytochrome c [Terriglobia bacterium]|jgi:cbb3-type cytochrome c oxidase subunit III